MLVLASKILSRSLELDCEVPWAAFLRPLFDRQLQLHDEQPRCPELIGVLIYKHDVQWCESSSPIKFNHKCIMRPRILP
jgi:hypothetical protein